MKNITLIGFMGTGKTEVAKLVANELGMEYVSTDDLIEKKENCTIKDIFSKKGENHFRAVEKEIVKEVSLKEGIVIDAGGGVCINPENIESLKKNGTIVCLWAQPEIILERTKKHGHRPLLNVEDPLGKIKALLKQRTPFYERADHHIDNSNMSLEEVANEVKNIIDKTS